MCVRDVTFPAGADRHAARVVVAAENVDDSVCSDGAGGDIAVQAGFRIPVEFARVGIQPPDFVGYADHQLAAAVVQRHEQRRTVGEFQRAGFGLPDFLARELVQGAD